MSRIGKHPVTVPEGVELSVDGQLVRAKGKLGELEVTLPPDVIVTHEEDKVRIDPRDDERRARSMWGMSRTLVQNIVSGVSDGFTTKLEISGVGFRAAMQGNMLQLQLGFSHDIMVAVPDGLTVKCETPTLIAISGADKQKVGQLAAEIRSYRPPEPYKGKGVKYEGEWILRKEGKKK